MKKIPGMLCVFIILIAVFFSPEAVKAADHNVSIGSSQPGGVIIDWDGVDAGDNFLIRYWVGQNGSEKQQTVAATDRRYTITEIGAATQFRAEVSEITGGTAVWTSSQLSGYTSGEPAIPHNADSTVNDASIFINWDDVAEVKSFVINILEGDKVLHTVTATKSECTINYADFKGAPSKTYKYAIFSMAYNNVQSTQSLSGTFKVPWQKPTAPTNLKVTASDEKSITLEWTPVAKIEGYHISRSESANDVGKVIGETGSAMSLYKDSSVSPGKTYYYTVTAFDKYGDSDPSNVVSTTAGPSKEPEIPTNVRVEKITDDSFILVWDPTPDATGYKIYSSDKKNGTFKEIADIETSTWVSSNLQAGTTYYIKIAAYNAIGTSKQSPVVEVNVDGEQTNQPLSISKMDKDAVTLTWPPIGGTKTYNIYRSLLAASGFERVAEVEGSLKSWTDKTVKANTKYYYKISAVTAEGEGELSAPFEVITPGNSGSGVTALILILVVVFLLVAGGTVLLYLYKTGKIGARKAVAHSSSTKRSANRAERRPEGRTENRKERYSERRPENRLENYDDNRYYPEPRPYLSSAAPFSAAQNPSSYPTPNRPQQQYPVDSGSVWKETKPTQEDNAKDNSAAWNWFMGDKEPTDVTESHKWPTETLMPIYGTQEPIPIAWSADISIKEPDRSAAPTTDAFASQNQRYTSASTAVLDKQICPNCYTRNEAGTLVCKSCGSILNSRNISS